MPVLFRRLAVAITVCVCAATAHAAQPKFAYTAMQPGFGGTNPYSFVTGATGTGQFFGNGADINVLGGANSHAFLWKRASAKSAVDMHPLFLTPTNSASSISGAGANGSYYGSATDPTPFGGQAHALVWTGATAASAVDMTPSFL